jgi:hypothetical protein
LHVLDHLQGSIGIYSGKDAFLRLLPNFLVLIASNPDFQIGTKQVPIKFLS